MRRLILGGSFNPIHNGHLICSRTVAETLGYDRVTLIPAASPPHKPEPAMLADSVHRLTMARLSVAGDALFDVDDLELSRAGPSYTFDTARQLIALGKGPVHWLIGADMLMYLPKWHRALELLAEVTFIIMARPGWKMDWESLPLEFRELQKNVVSAPLIDIRATDIRRRVSNGQSIKYLTPAPVENYIATHALYRG